MLESLTQQSHPHLWLLFQNVFGCHQFKRRTALRFLGDSRDVLEIGCSLGVVSSAFRRLKHIRYVGIDIDAQAIAHAKKRFSAFPHMEFSHLGLEEITRTGRTFDYVLFANILHHADDRDSVALLKQAIQLVKPGGRMVVLEPNILFESDSHLLKMTYKLERGLYRRSLEQLVDLAAAAKIGVDSSSNENASLDWLPGITWGRFLLLSMSNDGLASDGH